MSKVYQIDEDTIAVGDCLMELSTIPITSRPTNMHTTQSEERIKLFTELGQLLGFKVPTDGLLAMATKRWEIDILKLDREFSRQDHKYRYEDASCDGKPVSMLEYCTMKYGERATEIINLLNQ